jgi:acyl-CoA synthetase (AMP-forming)/AMP-acid ligase II
MRMVMDLGARDICNVYGLTECYGNCTVTDAHDPADVRLATVGRPLPGMELRIVDRETRRPLPPGEVGEILVHGHPTPGCYKWLDRDDPAAATRERVPARGLPRPRTQRFGDELARRMAGRRNVRHARRAMSAGPSRPRVVPDGDMGSMGLHDPHVVGRARREPQVLEGAR